MGTTTFSGPVKAGPIREGADVNTGNMVLAQTTRVQYTDEDNQILIGIIPSGALVTDIIINVITGFNAGTTNNISIGTLADNDSIVDNLAVADSNDPHDLTGILADADALVLPGLMSADTAYYAIYEGTGTAASAGDAYVTIQYTQEV